MDTITKSDVEKVAKLAHINLSASEIESYQREINSILQMIGILQELNVEGVEPLHSPLPSTHNLTLRPDIAERTDLRANILATAPQSKYGCFVVPKVVE